MDQTIKDLLEEVRKLKEEADASGTSMDDLMQARRPQHTDFKILCEVVNANDELAEDEDKALEIFSKHTEWSWEDFTTIAAENAVKLIVSNPNIEAVTQILLGSGDAMHHIPFYLAGWTSGVIEGLEHSRGFEVPPHLLRNPDVMWDIDGDTIRYMAAQRSARSVAAFIRLSGEEAYRPIEVIAALWMDGYMTGVRFDAYRDAYIG